MTEQPNLKIGDTIWRFDSNHRVYRKTESGKAVGGPIWREHWVKVEITGETSRSWIVGRGWAESKVPKKGEHGGYAFTQQEVDDDSYVHEEKRAIIWRMERVKDANILRQVARLIGYDTKKPEVT